jgi:hypothetical protein
MREKTRFTDCLTDEGQLEDSPLLNGANVQSHSMGSTSTEKLILSSLRAGPTKVWRKGSPQTWGRS